MNKRGISHIEMLLSFLIFAGFVIFALHFFSPFNASRLIESSLTYAKIEIIKNTTIEIESYSISLDVSNSNDLNSVVQIEIEDYDASKEVQAKNRNGDIVLAERVGSSNHIKFNTSNVYDTDPTKGFAIFRFGEGLIENPPPGGGGNNMIGTYTIISSEKEKFISESRIINLKTAYEKNYESVRNAFNLPSRANLEFEVAFSTTEKISAQRPLRPQSEEMFVNSKRIEVLRNTGEIQFADLKVRVW